MGTEIVYNTSPITECWVITLKEALTGINFDIEHLDNRIIKIKIDNVITPYYNIFIQNEGMPLFDDPTKFGNLIINFNILFPTSLSKKQIDGLKNIL